MKEGKLYILDFSFQAAMKEGKLYWILYWGSWDTVFRQL